MTIELEKQTKFIRLLTKRDGKWVTLTVLARSIVKQSKLAELEM